jgi:polar amino acid transport system substrate-binding protein
MCWRSRRPDRRRRVAAGVGGALLLALNIAAAQPAAPGRPAGAETVGCAAEPDVLARVQCTGVLRVGVRDDYPPFASRVDGRPVGFEIDLARTLATHLGVAAEFASVTPANRIAAVGEDRVDVVIATMGHTTVRDVETRFVRPHYYASRTVVVGERRLRLSDANGLVGRTVCVTVGNSTNAELAERGARLMLFGNVQQLVDQLMLGACALAAQDDSLFAHHFLKPDFAQRHDVKFGFAPLPWGMAVHKASGERLAQALGSSLQALHADGSLLRLAKRHGVDDTYLRAQTALWQSPACQAAAALNDPACVEAPHDARLQPTSFAPDVQRLEDWLQAEWGLGVTLAMLKTEIALELFLQGVAFSLLLVAGAVAATVLVSLAFAAGMGAHSRWLRWPCRALHLTAQSTPLVLMMLFAGVGISALGHSSPLAALATAIVVLGLFNGSNGGQAIAEARAALRRAGMPATLRQGAHHARAQLVAFVVNATRGSPAASIIGVPELLSAQTDIASFSSERLTTFTLLLVFYMAVVSAVAWLGQRWQERHEPPPPQDALPLRRRPRPGVPTTPGGSPGTRNEEPSP